MPRFSLDPTTETDVQTVKRTRFTYRYAYARSADSKANDDTGQDYLTVWHNEEQFIFVLCDGVSQSFYGDMGARFLAENLAGWLTQLPATSLQDFHDALSQRLTSLTQEATAYVNRVNMPADAPEILREVLLQKREGGSQTTFICGRVWFEPDSPENGRVYLAWMGDSKLRLWDADGECSHILGGQFITQERWSTKVGPIGTLHSCSLPLSPLARLIAYSDGLDLLDEQTVVPDTQTLNNLIYQAVQSPTSDDITLLDLQFHHTVPSRVVAPLPSSPARLVVKPDSHQLHIVWDSVPRQNHYYQLEIRQSGQPPYIRQVDTNQWTLKPCVSGTNYQFRVRAIRGTTPGDWSEPYQIKTPVTASPAVMARPTPNTTRSFAAQFAWAAMGLLVLLLTVTGYAWWSHWSTIDDALPDSVVEVVLPIEPSATWPPTPTIALAAVATDTPYEAPAVMLTDAPTAVSTNTPEPTATATSTPEPDESLFPTPVADQTAWLTPTPEIDWSRCYIVATELTYWLEPAGEPAGTFGAGVITHHVEQKHAEIDFANDITIWVQMFSGGEFRWVTEEKFKSDAVIPISCRDFD